MDENKRIGLKIFTARKGLQMSRAELGRLVDLHESTVKRYEDGEIKSLDIDKLKDFARALNISPVTLLGWEDDPDLIADLQGPVLDYFDGDVKKAIEFQKAVAEDALKEAKPSLPSLTPKDEREIARDLEAMINALDSKSGMAAFNKSDDKEDQELLKASLLTSMRLAKQIAKKKFTPKKHRKE
jgi:transcriptional regulator with XRE-family HTH domain